VSHAELVVLARRALERDDAGRAIVLEQPLPEQELTARGIQRAAQAAPQPMQKRARGI
jgi:hypothetical protein